MVLGRFERFLALASGALVALAAGLRVSGADATLTFTVAATSIVPLSHFMGLATEELGKHTGPAMGGLLNASFGNAAELSSALLMAWRNKMELAVGIAASSSTQIALFVAPILVLFSAGLGRPLDPAFEIFELVAIIVAVAVANMVSSDGESNWYEGVLLVLVYAIVAIGFYFHPPQS